MRLRVNSWRSALTTGINNSVTTIDGLDVGGFNLPTVASPNYLVIIIDPQATEGLPEIVHLTAHTGGNASGTVVRGAEGSTALAHSAGVEILVGPTVADFDFWTLTVDDDMSSLAAWQSNGDFTIDSGNIKGTKPSGASLLTRAAKTPLSVALVQCEVNYDSFDTSDSRLALLLGSVAGQTSGQFAVRLAVNTGGSGGAQIEQYFVANYVNVSFTATTATWYTMTALLSGSRVTFWVDGTLIGTAAIDAAGDISYLAIGVAGCVGRFRNLKVWTPSLPN